MLLGLSFPPFPFWPAALIALVPMLARWSRKPAPWMLFRETFSAFLIFAAISGYWVLFHADMLKALLLGVGVMVLPLLMALPVVGSALIARRFGTPLGILALVASWLALELLLVYGPIPVPWLLLGHTMAGALMVNQFADLLGVGGLTLWVLGVNLCVWGILEVRPLTPRFALVLGLVAIVAAPMAYSAWRTTGLSSSTESMRVAIVQPVLPSSDWSAIASADRVQILADMADRDLALLDVAARRARTRPQLVIWPEAALPVFPDSRLQQTLYSRVTQWSHRRQVALLAGAVTRFDTAPALTVEPYRARQLATSRPYYNSALLFERSQRPQQYDKMHMMPVADHVPVARLAADQGMNVGQAFGTGGSRTLFRTSGARFSSLISYEAAFGQQSRQMALDGAEFFTVLFNPSPWTFAPAMQQLEAIARIRAIETRRAVVMASVSGGSGVILPDGSSLTRAAWGERTVVVAEVPRHTALTTYVATGDILYRVGAMLTLVLFFAYFIVSLFFGRKAGTDGQVARKRLAKLAGETA